MPPPEPEPRKSRVKKVQTKEKHVKQEPKSKVRFYDDEPFEEDPAEEEPSGSRDAPKERSRSRSPTRQVKTEVKTESSDEELQPDHPSAVPAAPPEDHDLSSDEDLIPDSEYQRGLKRRHAPDKDDEGWGDLIVFDDSLLTDEHRFISDTGSFQFCKDLEGKIVDID